ncbi:MAG TPA: hypothetical protein VFD04_16175 [Actinomycetes bacterium]|nr:hypothetical protein [Actinomycetes bacterium]
MRRAIGIGVVLLAILAVVGIGVGAYNAGHTDGLAEGLRHSGETVQVVREVGPGFHPGYGYGFFPFGLILFPLLVIGIVLLLRGAFWRGRWGGPQRFQERFQDWHRDQHERTEEQARAGGDPGAV